MEEILKAITTLCIKVDSMDNEKQKLKTNEDNLKSKASQQHDYKNAELRRSEDGKNPELKGDDGKHLKTHNICLNIAAAAPQPPLSVRTDENSTIAGELSLSLLPSPSSLRFPLLISSLSLIPPFSSLRQEWRDKSPPPSCLSNQRKLPALSLPHLLRPASSK
ncbi:hypothetical protein MTR67_023639 [Solanum verrucosum]|uniref:Uncharacterized protein n=1 Tax=Solanum verrucosum TaxID=315347 RepID=A0AAF0QTU8_SOLVR|nr:hypothetical protein MTR67_023639 [Solanum verrucosum]